MGIAWRQRTAMGRRRKCLDGARNVSARRQRLIVDGLGSTGSSMSRSHGKALRHRPIRHRDVLLTVEWAGPEVVGDCRRLRGCPRRALSTRHRDQVRAATIREALWRQARALSSNATGIRFADKRHYVNLSTPCSSDESRTLRVRLIRSLKKRRQATHGHPTDEGPDASPWPISTQCVWAALCLLHHSSSS